MPADPTAPLPDEELAAIEADLAKYPDPSRNGPHDPLEYARVLLAALRAERTARDAGLRDIEDAMLAIGNLPLTKERGAALLAVIRAALAPATGEGAE
jgi:hypothetical protein